MNLDLRPITNCVVWSNSPDQIAGTAHVTYSNIQDGYPGEGNISSNPLFTDPTSGDYRLSPGSPCIDAGDSTAVPPGITTDLDGNLRFIDDPDTPDTGIGYPCVDMGGYEFQVAAPCPADINGDNTVNVLDLLEVLAAWGPCP